jgi:hypothetical protein
MQSTVHTAAPSLHFFAVSQPVGTHSLQLSASTQAHFLFPPSAALPVLSGVSVDGPAVRAAAAPAT